MAASTGPREAARKSGERQFYKMGAVKINKGTLVFARADGYAYPARSVAAIADLFLGVAFESRDNSTGAAGATGLQVDKSGSYVFNLAAVQANLGAPVYAMDDQTLTLTAGSTVILVGYIQEIIDAATVRIRIGRGVQ